MQTTAVASLTDHFHRFLKAVQEACGLHTGRGLLAAPMALLLWIRTRRMRKEAAAAMAEAFQALIQQFAVLLEDFRAGKLPAATPHRRWARRGRRPRQRRVIAKLAALNFPLSALGQACPRT
jgi:hypothetical protein